MRISVAMATYNGARYLQQQLDSLAHQTLQPFELVVGDDGSTDDTLAILTAFATQVSFPVRIHRNRKNLGYAENFLQAAIRCNGEWVAFCDQDDVWLPHKLSACAGAVTDAPRLNLVLQNAELCDAQLTPSGRAFPNIIDPGIFGPNSQFGFWVWLGCLQTVKTDLFRQFSFSDRPRNYFKLDGIQSHDKWTCMLANALGGIRVLSGIAALYRRHDGALTGSYARKSFFARVAQARSVGSGDYQYLASVAEESAEFLRILATASSHSTSLRARLTDSACWFDRLNKVQRLRQRLYSQDAIFDRAKTFVQLCRQGAYVGPAFTSMGLASCLKDLFVAGSGSTASEPRERR